LAQVGSETGGMGILRESMAYRTPARPCAVWPSRFGKKSDAFFIELIADPVKLADSVYGGRMGNRKGASDGYDTAGGMWIWTTGRYAVEKYCKALGAEASADSVLRFPVLAPAAAEVSKSGRAPGIA
jgi:predicted chitinase